MAGRTGANPIWVGVIAILVAIGVGATAGLGYAWWDGQQIEPAADPHRAPTSRDLGGSAASVPEFGKLDGQIVFRVAAEEADRIVLIGPDGERETLATGSSSAPWSTVGPSAGLYRVQMERGGGSSLAVVAEHTFELREPAETKDVAWAAAIGTAFGAASSIIGGVLASQTGVLVQVAQESIIGLGESRLKDAEEKRKAARGYTPKVIKNVRRTVIISVAFTVAMMSVFFTFEEMDKTNLTEFLAKIPLVAPVAGALALLAFGSEWLLALATGTVARFKVLWSGALTLVFSSTVFRTAFGFPGYIDEDVAADEQLPPHVEGIRGIASMAAFPAVLLPFVIVGWSFYPVVPVAMNVGLAGLAAVAMPFKPMPGNDVWRWNRLASLLMWAGAFTLFFGFELGFMAITEFFVVGMVCLVFLLGAAAWLWTRRQSPGWYRELQAQIREALHNEPAALRKARGTIVRANSATTHAIDVATKPLATVPTAVANRLVASKKAKAAQRGVAAAQEAFKEVGPEVEVITVVANGQAHVLDRKDVDEAVLALTVDEMFRKLPKTVDTLTVIDPASGTGRTFQRPR